MRSSEPEPAGISAPEEVELTRGRSTSLDVELTGAPCVLSLGDLPPGVSASPSEVALSRGSPRQTLVLSTSDDAPLGDAAAAFELRAEEGTGSPSRVPLRVRVTGRPGTLDPSFGDGGITSLGPAPASSTPVSAMGNTAAPPNAKLVQRKDGSLIVAWTTSDAPPRCRLARLDRNGARDEGFAPHARVLEDARGCTVRDMAVAPDDSLFLATTPAPPPDAQTMAFTPVMITRFGSETVDVTFGDGGTLRSAAYAAENPGPAVEQRLSVTSLGHLLVSGSHGTDRDVLDIAQYDADGRPDPTFADGGVLTRTAGGTTGTSLLQPDGHVLVPLSLWRSNEFGVLRLDPSGTTDARFGDGGVISVPNLQGVTVERVGVAPDAGDIIVAGLQIFRFDHDGADAGTTSFTPSGNVPLVTSDIAFARGQAHFVLRSAISLGKFDGFVLARLTPEGAPDEALGPGGQVEIRQPGYHVGSSLVVQEDGAWVVATRLTAAALGRDAASDPELVVERFFR